MHTKVNALFISNGEVARILRAHFVALGFRESGKLHLSSASDGVFLAGLEEKAPSAYSTAAGVVQVEPADEDPEEFDDCDEERADIDVENDVLEALTPEPLTVAQVAAKLELVESTVARAMGRWGEGRIAKVAPAREDGTTVSMFMATGTPRFDAFVKAEAARVESQIAKWQNAVLMAVPKAEERRTERPEILETICSSLPHESAEEIRRDCRAVFYGMAEKGLLDHGRGGWRAAETELDRRRMVDLQGAIREVLRGAGDDGLTAAEIRDRLPEMLPMEAVTRALRRMEGVAERYDRLVVQSDFNNKN